jgi:hypothetical protein
MLPRSLFFTEVTEFSSETLILQASQRMECAFFVKKSKKLAYFKKNTNFVPLTKNNIIIH